ncbi:hypothetical protein ABT255_61515 [Streptomyces mirabilis]|uniref:hypothetical protein n=1 Tax=Streptomyces mirabilis TaxID=68239 RepID=UPI00331CA567
MYGIIDAYASPASANHSEFTEMGRAMANTFDAIVKDLTIDASSAFPKYPPIASHVIKDPRVAEAIKTRLGEGAVLESITDFGYSFRSGLQTISFEFHQNLGRGAGVLVVADGECRVIGIKEGFDKEKPNPKLPPVPFPRPPLPFALARPVNAEFVAASGPDVFPLEVRSREFFEQLGLAANQSGTKCAWETSRATICAVRTDNPMGGPDTCDEWEERVTTDSMTDDC